MFRFHVSFRGYIGVIANLTILLMVQKSRIHSPVEGTVVCLPLGQVLYIRTVVGNGNSEASTVGMIIILPE